MPCIMIYYLISHFLLMCFYDLYLAVIILTTLECCLGMSDHYVWVIYIIKIISVTNNFSFGA